MPENLTWEECKKRYLRYLSEDRARCPSCGSDEIEETSARWINHRIQWANWHCGMCEFRWREWMTVFDIEEIEDDIQPASVPDSCLALPMVL